MSVIISKEMPCSQCQFPNEVEVWSIINALEDPELKDILLGGELNMIECSSCGHVFYAEDFLLYHDPSIELMAFVYPLKEQTRRERMEEKTRLDFGHVKESLIHPLASTYEPITLFGLDELVRLIEWQDEALLQSEVAAFIASEKHMVMKKVLPRFYRKHRLPPLLPDSLVSGIATICLSNEKLNIFSEARSYLAARPELVIEWAP